MFERVLICGSRTFRDIKLIDRLVEFIQPKTIIHGGAVGADALASVVAMRRKIMTDVFKANWDSFAMSAGPIRNQMMLDAGKPDLVLAFWNGESRGTKDMIDRAKFVKVPLIVFRPDELAVGYGFIDLQSFLYIITIAKGVNPCLTGAHKEVN